MRDNEELVVKADPYIYINAGTSDFIEIDAELKTIIVRNEIKDSNLQVGDAILKLDNKDFANFINKSNNIVLFL